MIEKAPSVLHFLWTGEIGGAERAVFQLVREQLRQGTHVGVAFGQAKGLYADSLLELGCQVISLGASGGADLRTLPKGINAIRGFDIHHFHGIEPLTFFASILSGPHVRVFTQRAGIRELSPRKRFRHRLVKHALVHDFHAWCGNTSHAKEALHRNFGIPLDAIDVVHNGIDFELLRPEAERNAVRLCLGIPEGVFVVGSTAILKEWKRIDLLLEASALLDPTGLAILIVGDGPDRSRLESVAQDLGIQNLVFFTGIQERVADLVHAMDAFVLPSGQEETFGNAVVEAMALGIPSTVFSDSPGLRGHIRANETGFVVGDVEELRALLDRLRSDLALRARVGTAGAKYIRATYGIDRTAHGYATLYAKGTSRWSSRRRSKAED